MPCHLQRNGGGIEGVNQLKVKNYVPLWKTISSYRSQIYVMFLWPLKFHNAFLFYADNPIITFNDSVILKHKFYDMVELHNSGHVLNNGKTISFSPKCDNLFKTTSQ